jgi:Mg-chelatase subunit ChlD
MDAAFAAARCVRRRGISAVVVDAEDGETRLGLARALADEMGASYLTLGALAEGIEAGGVRDMLDPARR